MSQSNGKLPNLGKYSIRTEESSNDFQVGSFYKRQSLEANDSRNSKQKYPYENPVSTEKQVRSSKNEPNIQEGPSKSNDSKIESKLATKDAKIRALEDRFDDKKKAKRDSNKLSESEASSKDYPTPKIHSVSDTTSPSKEDIDTRESVVINLDPTAFVDNISDEPSEIVNLKNTSQPESFILYTPNINKRKRKKLYPKRMPYDKIMSEVTFVLSGYENPRRSQLRDLALDMGALYKPFWEKSSCTHLM